MLDEEEESERRLQGLVAGKGRGAMEVREEEGRRTRRIEEILGLSGRYNIVYETTPTLGHPLPPAPPPSGPLSRLLPAGVRQEVHRYRG